MSTDQERFEMYSRMLALRDFDEDTLRAIESTTVTVVGAGGLGSPVLRLLTAIGFGKIRIIDHDVVELSNLQRQTIYNYEDIGTPKVEAAVANLSKQNPFVRFEPVGLSITTGNALELLRGSDIIVDGLDSMEARRAVNSASYALKIPYVYAGAIEYYANISTFIPDETGCLYCLVGDVEDNPENTCANVGVSPSLLSLVGAIEVRETVCLASGKQPQLAGKLMHVDIDVLGFDTFAIARSEACPICSDSEIKPSQTSDSLSVTMLCTNSYSISPTQSLDLDLSHIAEVVRATRTLKRKTSLIIKLDSDISVTLMSTGSAVIKGAKDREHALSIYNSLLSNQ